ncbi:unnamed protein product [Penicillium bialowiezense]
MATRPVIEFYFSFISLWSYIGSRRFQQLAKQTNAQIVYKPIDLLHIFSISGGLPVKQRSEQRQAYRLLEMERWRKIRDIPIVQQPKFYPADPSLAHRVLLAAIEEKGADKAVWARELDIADRGTIIQLADESGLEGARLLKRAESESYLAKQEADLVEEAELRNVFGAPFYILNGESFWGQDRLEMLQEVIESGRGPIYAPDS